MFGVDWIYDWYILALDVDHFKYNFGTALKVLICPESASSGFSSIQRIGNSSFGGIKAMHLWPSMRLRDSFKIEYLKKLEWNLHRMNAEKKQQQQQGTESSSNDGNQQKLLNDSKKDGKFLTVCRELFLILSCCYCCFCCGGNP